MKTRLFPPISETKPGIPQAKSGKSEFHAVAAYANDTCAEKINEVLSHLERRLGKQFDVSCESWDFERLAKIDEFRSAREAAASADMVFLAAPTDRNVPAVIRRWLDQSFSHPTAEDRALVVLLGGNPHDGADTEEALRDVAAHGGADFFPHYFDPRNLELLGSTALLEERSTRVTSLLAGILDQKDRAAHHGLKNG